MNLRHALLAGLCCLAVACGRTPPGEVGLDGPCLRTADCASPFVCQDGACKVPPDLICEGGANRCSGNNLEVCKADNSGWEVTKECPAGCINGACSPEVCTPNKETCSGQFIEKCLPNGSGTIFVQACPTTCCAAGDAGCPAEPNKAECTAPVCDPFSTRCKEGSPGTLETCNSRGTAWTSSSCGDPNAAVCVEGRCLAKVCAVTKTGTTITNREERCRGTVAEQCNDTETAFTAKEICTNGCEFAGNKATCPPFVCVPFSTQCKDLKTVQTCNRQGTAYVDAACSTSAAADDNRCIAPGQCVPKVCSSRDASGALLAVRQTRCGVAGVERCNEFETGWEPAPAPANLCAFGCGQATPTSPATCNTPVCALGEEKCDGTALLRCQPNQAAFGFVTFCPSGCSPNTATNPDTASCLPPVCTPQRPQCGIESGTGTHFVETCRADGSGFSRTETCPQTCSGGSCVVTNDTCIAGDIRCKGFEVEQCFGTGGGGTEWRFVELCLGQCSNGACDVDSGACGCSGGTAGSPTRCGETARPAITLKTLIPAADKIPCDNVSRVLVYSDKVISSNGSVVPDGTMVTFTHDGTDSLFASADADTKVAGIQRPTLHGVATVVVKSPATACPTLRSLKVTATVGGRCNGSTTISFQAPVAQGGDTSTKLVYTAEDFSTTTYQDRAFTTAAWDTARGATASPAYDLGTGADGDLTVPNTTSVDLQALGFARAHNVLTIGSTEVSIDGFPNLSAGDEVLLITLTSTINANSIGNYEFKKVASVASGRVVFTTPVTRTYGSSNNDDLTGARVVIQRVPHFRDITINSTGTLTSTQYQGTTGGTGVLAFRASGTVKVGGYINMVGSPGTELEFAL